MRKITVPILLILLITAIFQLPIQVGASGPTEVDVTVVSEDVDLDVNIVSDNADISLNGLSADSVTIDGDPVATASDVKGRSSKESIWELRDRQRALQASVDQISSNLDLTGQAVAKLISQGPLLYTRLDNLEEDSTDYFADIYVLYDQIEYLNQKMEELVSANIALNQQIVSRIDGVYEDQVRLENRIAELERENYVREHSGFVYRIKSVFAGIGACFANLPWPG